MASENLPIYKSALDLAVYVEQIVRKFEKYHKYTLGVDLREKSKVLLFAISRANLAQDKVPYLQILRDSCEEMKMLIQLSRELRAFHSFKQFEQSSFLTVSVCKQAQAWLQAQKRWGGAHKCRSLQICSAKCAISTVRPFCQSA